MKNGWKWRSILILLIFLFPVLGFGEVIHDAWYENMDGNGSLAGYYHIQFRKTAQAYYYQLDVINLQYNQEINASCRYSLDFYPEYLSYVIKERGSEDTIMSDTYSMEDYFILHQYRLSGRQEMQSTLEVPTLDVIFIDQVFFFELVVKDNWVLDSTIERYALNTGADANITLRTYHVLAPQAVDEDMRDQSLRYMEVVDQLRGESFLVLDEQGFIVQFFSRNLQLNRMTGTPPIE